MKSFDYHKPSSLPEAVSLLAKTSGSLPIAGGMSLLPTMKQRLATPQALIDLSGIAALKGITSGTEAITIGAMTRHVDVATSPLVAKAFPALARLAGNIGDPAVRNRGTIGGSLANNDPAADYPAAVLALGATIATNAREIAADQFFCGMFETELKPGELITAVKFPLAAAAGYAKVQNAASRYALVGVFVAKFASGVRVAVTGAAPVVFRVPVFEATLSKRFEPGSVNGHGVDPATLNTDIHAEAAFRAHLIGVMAKRAVVGAQADA
jgi:aerobic carbon-monoxide dehydrogenase medium subunit